VANSCAAAAADTKSRALPALASDLKNTDKTLRQNVVAISGVPGLHLGRWHTGLFLIAAVPGNNLIAVVGSREVIAGQLSGRIMPIIARANGFHAGMWLWCHRFAVKPQAVWRKEIENEVAPD